MEKPNNWVDLARKQREIAFEPKYGPIQPKTDPRCFRREMVEELLDALNYAEWARVKGEIDRKQWRWLNNGIRAVLRTIEMACADRFEWVIKNIPEGGGGKDRDTSGQFRPLDDAPTLKAAGIGHNKGIR